MFGRIPETQYDVRFQLLGIPVRIHPAFFVVSLVFGWRPGYAQALGLNPFTPALLWMVSVFVSILIHELGHAVMAFRFGWRPEIVLYHFGGLAMFTPSWGNSRGKQIAIALAGPGAGFLLFGVVILIQFLAERQGLRQSPIAYLIFQDLEFINLWWGLVNLLPVYPLDGGQVAMQIFSKYSPHRGMQLTLELGVAMGILIAVGSAVYFQRQGIDYWYPSILFGILAMNNYQMLQAYRGGGGYW